MKTAKPVVQHRSWCVLNHTHGRCEDKRGTWDRSTNTYHSQLSEDDRRMILRALIRYRKDGESRESVIDWVRTHPGFENTSVNTLQGWYMIYLKYWRRGERWPI
jgi:hypothetical protein